MSFIGSVARRATLLASAAIAAVAATPAAAVVVNNGLTPAQAVDPVNITGIGQMIVSAGGGSIGLCTGTLINPRTVIFAAHCVNSRAATAYGSASGGTPIGFGFQADNLAATRGFVLAGPNQNRTNTALAFYNASQVIYNPQSLALGAGNNFLQADVALAALDTPATAIPTWTMLFSPLATPASISTSGGTGYHVTLAGYGRNGTGTTGDAGGIDYRRRVAENTLGALASLDDVYTFLYGTPEGLPQNLYFVDFDDPRRGTAGANPRDFNIFRDNALPREGITASGDSGGPLIVDRAFARPTVVGVLSGGSRYFNNQPSSSYGTDSFYQPLYLFWDYIVANNPYRYVSATAGDGLWTDPAHWVTNLDPAYQVLGANGQLVNGVPTSPGAGIAGTTPKFGEVCFQLGGGNECQNLATGQMRNNVPNEGGALADAADGSHAALRDGGVANVTLSDAGATATIEGDSGVAAQATGVGAQVLPVATPANGLPGATGFVPNNTNGVRLTATPARYYDVTLSAAGTTTLNSAATIDRLTISGANSGLTVGTAGTLTSLVDITQFAGRTTVNGRLATQGDYALLGGLLTGTGTVQTPFLTSVLGSIAPGSVGTIGTLTVAGNVVLSSASQLSIDIGANGASDRLATIANGTSTGAISLNGTLGLAPVAGYRPTFNDRFTFVSATGAVTGGFSAVSGFSGVLFPELIYSATGVTARINARSYTTVIDNGRPVQSAYARLLDGNRGQYALLAGLYGDLDGLNAAPLQAVLEGLAPRTEATKLSMARMGVDTMGRFYRDRLAFLRGGDAGGTLAMIGNPVQLAALQTNMTGDQPVMSDQPTQAAVLPGIVLPETVSAFVAGGYVDGSARPLRGTIVGGRDQIDGWYVAGGVETEVGAHGNAGIALHYVDLDGSIDAPNRQTAGGKLLQGSIYATYVLARGLTFNAQTSVGSYYTTTERTVSTGGAATTLGQKDRNLAISVEGGLGQQLAFGGFALTPNVALRYNYLDGSNAVETGGPAALAIVGRSKGYENLQGRAGVDLGGEFGSGGTTIRPRVTGAYVRQFLNQPTLVNAAFAATGYGVQAPFLLPSDDKSWFEVGGGVRIAGKRLSLDLSADTTIERKDIRYRTYRAGVAFAF